MTTHSVTAISILMLLTFSSPLLSMQAQAGEVDAAQGPARVSEPCNKGDKDVVQESTTVKSSKSNSSERLATPPSTAPAEKSNLNLSKSNVDRKKQEQDPCETADPDG